jgi:hypothetical protein
MNQPPEQSVHALVRECGCQAKHDIQDATATLIRKQDVMTIMFWLRWHPCFCPATAAAAAVAAVYRNKKQQQLRGVRALSHMDCTVVLMSCMQVYSCEGKPGNCMFQPLLTSQFQHVFWVKSSSRPRLRMQRSD